MHKGNPKLLKISIIICPVRHSNGRANQGRERSAKIRAAVLEAFGRMWNLMTDTQLAKQMLITTRQGRGQRL